MARLTNGGIVGKSVDISLNNGKWNLTDQHIYKQQNFWGNYVTSGLILYYDAAKTSSYPGSGNIWYDISGYSSGRELTLYNSPSYVSGSAGYFAFNGSNNYAMSTNMSSLISGLNETTVSVFYRSTAQDNDAMVWDFCNTDGNRDRFSMRQNWGGGQTSGYNSTPSKFGVAYFGSSVSGAWKNYVFTRRSGVLYAYINGSLYSTGDSMTEPIQTVNKLIIGQDNINTNYIYGDFANFMVYSRGLTSDEINQNFNFFKGRYGL